MKRVKTSSPTPERTKPQSEPPSLSTSVSGGSLSNMATSGSTAFKSPLLQGLIGNKTSSTSQESGSTSQSPSDKRFASSLLNNLMGKKDSLLVRQIDLRAS